MHYMLKFVPIGKNGGAASHPRAKPARFVALRFILRQFRSFMVNRRCRRDSTGDERFF
jgi:hypothetical protein